ncbi:ParM/StbA family protein [Anaerocolumna xylanovorans]|uniref:Plasmid segregation actin-type ATPase ParM n=1 Tax=Anaerocolumna xylanovorans DSM 12503 TaxID=1121345 RepID=A0A1M7YNQ7_9FIRM|nr:ParM/StbA family protein [Anaerocolumna xylanovorans]SHO54188.1 plasmid segregation actin-type ATPase ParM [Anaerocolumna xylanovorans DSM 12503]
MLIAIDHGNKQMKSIHKTFTSGLIESKVYPLLGDDILKRGGFYYAISNQRIPYMRDKTLDNRFFTLTLFAIAHEILAAGAYSANNIIDVQLAVGLPPAHYGAQYERFEKYLMGGNDIIEFEFRNKPYSIYISEVLSFPQAYAAAMPIYSRIRDVAKATIIDIGGFTVDYLQVKKGKADLSVCDSLEDGVITLYNKIKSKVNATYDILLEESDIDVIISGETTTYEDKILHMVENEINFFTMDLLSRLRERMIDLKNGIVIFVGGGSILLRKYLEGSGKVGQGIFVDDISANVRGYELLYRAHKAGR